MKNLFRISALVLLWATTLHAQEPTNDLDEQTAARVEALIEEIAGQKEDMEALEARAAEREGVMAELLMARRDRLWTATLKNTLTLARQITAERDAGRDVSEYWDPMLAELNALPLDVQDMLQRVEDRAEFATGEQEVHRFVYSDQRFFREIEAQHELFEAMIDYITVAALFDIDVSEYRESAIQYITDHAANVSIFLTMAQNDYDNLSATATTLPANTEVAEWLSAADTRIRESARAMQNVVTLMNKLGLQTRMYRQQLLTATGEITADVLDVGLVRGLIMEWGQAGIDLARKQGLQLIFRLLFVVVILFAFWQLGKLVQRVVEKGLGSGRVRMSYLLKKMIVSIVRNLIFFIGILLAISQFGISLGPLLAGLGIAGFIIGFALQDTLSNFASGMMILIYRPFDVGDLVEAGGVSGKVSHMSLVNTTFMTLDNQRLVVPNNMIWQSVITNVTAQRVRRIDLLFGVSYSDDLDKVEKILNEIVEENESVLDSPEPIVKMHELADSSVNFVVRPWVKTDDYWETYWAVMKAVKQRFDAEGISIPFPQRDVHMIEPATSQ